MRAVIICGGNAGEYIKDYIAPDDFIICADSGLDHAEKLGIRPDVVIGDMDSVKSKNLGDNAIIYPVRKDFTDSELATDFAKEKGADKILMFGMIGDRMDHTIANITLLKNTENAVIIDEKNEIYLVKGEFSLCGKIGDVVSIVPVFGDISGVSTKGLDYPLVNGQIKCGTTLGVSNVMTQNKCTIVINEGTALVIRSRE